MRDVIKNVRFNMVPEDKRRDNANHCIVKGDWAYWYHVVPNTIVQFLFK